MSRETLESCCRLNLPIWRSISRAKVLHKWFHFKVGRANGNITRRSREDATAHLAGFQRYWVFCFTQSPKPLKEATKENRGDCRFSRQAD